MSLRVIDAMASNLGEGPHWDALTQTLWWVDIIQRRLHRWNESSGHQMYNSPMISSAVLQARDDHVLLASEHGIVLFKNSDFHLIKPVDIHRSETRSNEAQIDPFGRVLISTMDKAIKNRIGALYLVDSNSTRCLLNHLMIPNTLQWSPDKKYLYLADSAEQSIYRYAYHEQDPVIGPAQLFFSSKGCKAVPDGSAIDSDGYLWTALWDGWCVVRISPAGDIDQVISLPVQRPTSCVFGGENRQTLFITSASKGLSDAELQQQPLAGKVFAIDVAAQGVAPHGICKFDRQC